jgi:hypothetical protein
MGPGGKNRWRYLKNGASVLISLHKRESKRKGEEGHLETSIDRLRQGKVNRRKSHFELRFGAEPAPIAVIAPPKAGVVNVQFLVDPGDEVISKVLKEIKHYLLELGEPDPWAYAQYHCGTSANLYSEVQWSFVDTGDGVLVSPAASKDVEPFE